MDAFFSGPGFGIGILLGLILLPFIHALLTVDDDKKDK